MKFAAGLSPNCAEFPSHARPFVPKLVQENWTHFLDSFHLDAKKCMTQHFGSEIADVSDSAVTSIEFGRFLVSLVWSMSLSLYIFYTSN